MTTQQNSCAADEQECVFGSFEFDKNSVLKIFMINGPKGMFGLPGFPLIFWFIKSKGANFA